MTNEEKIQLIGQKIFMLSQHMDRYRAELDQLRMELEQLKKQSNFQQPPIQQQQTFIPPQYQQPVVPPQQFYQQPNINPNVQQNVPPVQQQIRPNIAPAKKSGLEEYIGGKLVSIIGICLLVIGLCIGVKYAIDNGFLGAVGRISLGFVSGLVIMTFAFFLREKYKLFSAIILGGGIALLFFTSFAGHAFYNLYPRELAFALMIALTGFTVLAAHLYNYEVLAVLALIGAYAVPPMLDDHKGNIHYMFIYMTIINAGILFLSFKKYWNWLTYTTYIMAWLVYGTWMMKSYYEERYFATCFTFLTVFFVMFYSMFIAYKLIRAEQFSAFDVLRIMSNSAIFFGVGYYLLNTPEKEHYLGLFCIANALIHLSAAAVCHYKKAADRKVVFLILTLVFTFITVAVPVQLEGNWVTMIWFTEMALLWFIGTKYAQDLFRHMAFALGMLGTFSLLHDWSFTYYAGELMGVTLLFNKYFLTTLFGIGATLFVGYYGKTTVTTPSKNNFSLYATTCKSIGLVLVYLGIVNEIILQGRMEYIASGKNTLIEGLQYSTHNDGIMFMTGLFILMYSALYTLVLDFLANKFIKTPVAANTGWTLRLIALILCCSLGLIFLSATKSSYHNKVTDFQLGSIWLYFRYLFLPFIIVLLVSLNLSRKNPLLTWTNTSTQWLSHVIIVLLLSNELTFIVTETNYEDYEQSFKLAYRIGYTILWGLYSMFLTVWGFAAKKKTLRFIAISLFAVTLLKLGVDAFSMSKINKLITLCSVGLIFVIVGFLYQKFKHVLLEADEQPVNQS